MCGKNKPYIGKQNLIQKEELTPEKNEGLRVVLDLPYGLRKHNVICVNFFTSYDLRQMLLRKNITMLVRILKNKPFIPTEMLQTKVKEKCCLTFSFTKDTTLF